MPPSQNLPPDEMLWTAREVANYLRASMSWVYKAAENGKLPCIHLGAMLRFEPAAVRAHLHSRVDRPSVTITPLPSEPDSE